MLDAAGYFSRGAAAEQLTKPHAGPGPQEARR